MTVEHLIGSYNSRQRSGRRSTCPLEARLEQKHFIEYIPYGKRKKCVVCGDRPQLSVEHVFAHIVRTVMLDYVSGSASEDITL